MIIKQYTTEVEKQALIDDFVGVQGKFLVEMRYVKKRKFIIFEDTPKPIYADPNQDGYHKLPLAKLTPVQLDSYIDTNVTDLASAKVIMKMLAKAIIRIAKKVEM